MERKLMVGDLLTNQSASLEFKILDIDEKKNTCKVMVCSGQLEWEEAWDDLDNVYNAIETGEYEFISAPLFNYERYEVEKVPAPDPISMFNMDYDYCYTPSHEDEVARSLPFKRKGSAKYRR